MATNVANADIMGVPATLPIDQTGKERATAMMNLFTDVISAWSTTDDKGELTEITALIGDGNGGTGPDNLKVTALGSSSATNIISRRHVIMILWFPTIAVPSKKWIYVDCFRYWLHQGKKDYFRGKFKEYTR